MLKDQKTIEMSARAYFETALDLLSKERSKNMIDQDSFTVGYAKGIIRMASRVLDISDEEVNEILNEIKKGTA